MAPKTFQEAESLYDRAVGLEFATEFASAFHIYLEAAEASLQLARSSAASPDIQARCRAMAAKALQRAEKIKKASKTPGAQTGTITTPIDAEFGADYQACVIRRSSTVNNIRYPLWDVPVPLPSNPRAYYTDPDGQPTGSATVTWKRPPLESFAPQELSSPTDIDQNSVDDCSVCASISVSIQHNQRFGSGLLSSSLLPGNQLGRYDVKAYLNGGYRRISIDDLLPFDDAGRPMGISSRQNAVLWPTLIEKAYMKLMGGYNFPGSNSCIDLRVLAGWIPDHVELQSTSFEKERTWEIITNGFRRGDCVLTAGTDAKTTLKIEGVRLLPSHDYAVVDIRETESERWVSLVDSTVSVARPYSRTARKNHASPSNSRLLDLQWDDICATFEGIYVSWDPKLFQNGAIFHGVWKPADASDKMQESMRHLRLLYERQSSRDTGVDMNKDVWVLLTRHFFDTRREAEYISMTVRSEDEDDWRRIRVKMADTGVKGSYTTSPHVLVRTKIGEGFPTSSQASPLASQSPHSGALSILAGYDGPFDDIFFTLEVFCGADLKVWWDKDAGTGDSISSRGGFSVKVDGTLTTKNAGGNHSHPTYMLNPQWHLRIYESTGSGETGTLVSDGRMSPLRGSVGSSRTVDASGKTKTGQKSIVVLSAQGRREVPLNVTVVWSSGERIVQLAQKEVVTSSGAYTYGRARATVDMARKSPFACVTVSRLIHYQAGDYTVILSAFEPQTHLGQFTLKVESSRQFDLTPIPQEGAGMYVRVSKGEWDEHTAVGGPSHGRYHSNPIYEVRLRCSAQLSARLHLTSPAPTTALNLTLFPASPSASDTFTLDRPLASSGPYNDALSGVSIPTRMLSPGRYWLIPSTFTAGTHASFRLVVYSSDAGCVVSRR